MTITSEPSQVPIWPFFVEHLLSVLSDGQTWPRRPMVAQVLERADLPESALAETLNSGGLRAEERVGWAISNLVKAGFIERPQRATYRITDAGRRWFGEHPSGISSYAEAHQTFAQYWPHTDMARSSRVAKPEDEALAADVDPIEQIDAGVDRINDAVATELLERLRVTHPDFFEDAVVKVLLAMGYGGAERRGRRVGGTGDGGIDGVIDQDALGLDRIYLQAKRYKDGSNIGRETIQAFIGALHGVGATRGVFITTSAFSRQAEEYVANLPTRVVLIDGERLVALMLRYRVGVQVKQTYEIVEIDEDFFE